LDNRNVLHKVGNRTLTVTVLISAILVVSLILFYPVIESEAGPPVPTEVIVLDPLNPPAGFEFGIESSDAFSPGIHDTRHDLFVDTVNKNFVSFWFNDRTSRSNPDNNIFSHHATVIIGTAFIAPFTGNYELTFEDEVNIDSTKSYAHMNFFKRPRADDNYVASFAKFSYDVRAEHYDSGIVRYFTTQNQADIKDLEVLISAENIRAAAGVPPPVKTFATEQPEKAEDIADAAETASNILVGLLGTAVGCPLCGTALGAVTGPLVNEEVAKLLNEESNIFSTITNIDRNDDDDGDRITVQKNFGANFNSATTFEVELEEGELVFLSSRVIVGINQVDSSSRHRHAAGIAGDYELKQITIRIFETTPPVITLQGDNPLVIEAGDGYVEPGTTVEDNAPGYDEEVDIDSSGVVSNTVGSYIVTYNAPADAQGNVPLEVTRTVDVVDTTPPEITLLGPNPLILQVDDPYVEPGADVTDNTDEDLSGALVIVGVVNTSTLGTYFVTYNVMDSSGNAAIQVTRTVEVFDQVIDSVVDGPLKVGDGERVFISGGTINGNIKLGAGTLIFEEATINGNIQGNAGSTLSLKNSSVSGFVQMKNCTSLTIVDSQIDSNVTVQNCENFTLTGSTVGGNVDSKNTQTVVIIGNDVDGNIGSNGDGQVTIDDNSLTGIITVV